MSGIISNTVWKDELLKNGEKNGLNKITNKIDRLF